MRDNSFGIDGQDVVSYCVDEEERQTSSGMRKKRKTQKSGEEDEEVDVGKL